VTSPFVGEIRMGGWSYAPVGWAMCNGQLLPIAQNTPLFQVIGTIYGGDGQTTFAVPDLRGRLPVHAGPGFAFGQAGGTETVTLTASQFPMHSHPFVCSTSPGAEPVPTGNVPAAPGGGSAYVQAPPTAMLDVKSIGPATPSSTPPLAHDNMQPYLCVTFIIALTGVFPSQS
jgi:microcystin-dependent protein